jgi:hypothetical protein
MMRTDLDLPYFKQLLEERLVTIRAEQKSRKGEDPVELDQARVGVKEVTTSGSGGDGDGFSNLSPPPERTPCPNNRLVFPAAIGYTQPFISAIFSNLPPSVLRCMSSLRLQK